MNLGLGLEALGAYFREGDAQKDRDYMQKKREYELSTMPDRVAADTATNRLRAAQAGAETGLVDDKAEMVRRQTELRSSQLQGEIGRQPIKEQTLDAAAMGDRSKTLLTQKLAEVDANDLPSAIVARRSKNLVSEVEAKTAALSALGNFVANNDSAGAAHFINRMGQIVPENERLTSSAVSVGTVPINPGDPSSPKMLIALDANGKPVTKRDGSVFQVPLDRIRQGAPAKIEKVMPGQTLVQIGENGAQHVYTAPKAGLDGVGKQPAEVQTMEWLIGNGVAKSPQDAWSMIRSGREKSKATFIAEYVSKQAGMGLSPEELAIQASKAYDAISNQPQGAAATKNPDAAKAAEEKLFGPLGLK